MKDLLIIDVQNDFCPGGALGAPGTDEVVPVINELLGSGEFDRVLASKDWHPEETVHFEKWPPHCVRNTRGAEFHPDLKHDKIDKIFYKGTGNKDDGYSAFEATNEDLEEYLKGQNVDTLYVAGLTGRRNRGSITDRREDRSGNERGRSAFRKQGKSVSAF